VSFAGLRCDQERVPILEDCISVVFLARYESLTFMYWL